MTIAQWLPFLLLCVAMELTPGPNMAYLAILTIQAGRRAGFFAIAGIALGLSLIGVLAAFGVAEIVSNSPPLSHLLSGVGFIYLLWLAWDTWRVPVEPRPQSVSTMHPQYFVRGLVTNLLNPKAFMFYVAVVPGFIGGGNTLSHALVLTCIYVFVATSVHVVIVLLAGQAAPYLSAPHRQRRVRQLMALLLVGVALWFVAANYAK